MKLININRAHWICVLLAVCFLFSPLSAMAQGDILSGDVFLAIMLKALNYDRSIDRISSGKITIGVIYINGDKEAQKFAHKMQNDFLKVQSQIQIKGMPVEVKILGVDNALNTDSLKEQLQQNHISAVAVATRDPGINEIIFETTRSLGVDSVCNNSACVEQGSGLGIALKKEKPRLMANLNALKLERSDFSSKLLALCEIVQ